MDNLEKEKLEIKVAETELAAREFIQSYSSSKKYIFIVLLILIIPAFFIAKYLTAKLYIDGYNRTAISVHPATFVTLPIDVQNSGVLPVSGENYSAYAFIKNPNKQLSASDIRYRFHFFDVSGSEVSSASGGIQGSTFLLPGDQKYIIAPSINFGSFKPVSAKIEFSNLNWINRLSIPQLSINLPLPTYADTQDPKGFAVDGNFRNDSDYSVKTVFIKAVVFDKNGNIIAVNQTAANTVSPKEQRGYHMFWPISLQSQTGNVQVYAETNVLDLSNLQ